MALEHTPEQESLELEQLAFSRLTEDIPQSGGRAAGAGDDGAAGGGTPAGGPAGGGGPADATFEQNMARLETILSALERGEAPLGEAMALFEEGAGLLRLCTGQLDRAEQTIVLLQRGAEGAPLETAFEPGPLEDGRNDETGQAAGKRDANHV